MHRQEETPACCSWFGAVCGSHFQTPTGVRGPFANWDEMLRVYVHDWQLQQLPTPVSNVSVDLVAGRLATEKAISDLGKQLRNLDPSLAPLTSSGTS